MAVTPIRRCFVGWVGPDTCSPVVPAGRTPVGLPGWRLWTVGDWSSREIRVAARPAAGTSAVFLGACLATAAELQQVLRAAVAGAAPQVLQTLPGSYAVMLQDANGAQVLTDRAGLHPLFHTAFAGGTMFASDALVLAALHHHNLGESVNQTAVAAGLFLPDLPELFGTASVLRRVERVGSATVVNILPDRRPTTRPLLNAARQSVTPDAAGVALRAALVNAVGRRVGGGGDVSADLSGGLDSSSVAVLAARAGATPVAITYADPHAVNDEDVHLAGTVAAGQPRLRHVVVTGGTSVLPFTDMGSTPVTDEPSLDAVIFARTRHRLIPAVEHHSQLHLTGDGGDAVLAAPGLTYLADLARQRRRRELRHEVTGWARLRHSDARRVHRAVTRLAATSWTDTTNHLADRLADGHPSSARRPEVEAQLAWASLSPAAAWGTSHARRGLIDHLRAAGSATGDEDWNSADAVAARTVRWHGAATRGFTQITRALGLTVAAPFLDGPVIDVCLAVPATERTTVDHAKPLLTAALGALMPPGLLTGRTKGDYSSAEYHGLRANARSLHELLAAPLLAELGVLDPTGPRQALRLGLSGAPAPMGALGAVIATETWLRALDTLSPSGWWEPRTPKDQR